MAKMADVASVELLSTDLATDVAVADGLPRARWAHLATHGNFVVANDEQVGTNAIQTPVSFERNPLAMSGLALAGANVLADDIDQGRRGILTGESIAALDLRNLSVAVLSACQTALGKQDPSEGVYGLQRSFHVAGTQNVIASLWKIDDRATAVLMTQYYQNLWGPKRMSPLDCLRAAQLEMLRGYDETKSELRAGSVNVDVSRDSNRETTDDSRTASRTPPYYWAAFQLSGRGR
jgi:CHAT domain-containing protein